MKSKRGRLTKKLRPWRGSRAVSLTEDSPRERRPFPVSLQLIRLIAEIERAAKKWMPVFA
jgi:hypothetical protein